MNVTTAGLRPFVVKLQGIDEPFTVLVKSTGNRRHDRLAAYNHALAALRSRTGNRTLSPLAEAIH